MHKDGFKELCKFLVISLIILVSGQKALAYTAGWEAVNQYHGYLTDLYNCVNEGEKFEDAIYNYSSSWTVDFGWRDDAAYEEDFKVSTLGGTDYKWADNVDLMLFSGHGSKNGFYFGTTVDDHMLHYEDAYWGDQNLEWIIIDACNVLFDDDTLWDRWGWPVFKGLHYILGYNTECYDVDTRGRDFIKYAMYLGYTVRLAWIHATIDSEDGTMAAYLRADSADTDTYNDHLFDFGSVSTDPINPTNLYYSTWNT